MNAMEFVAQYPDLIATIRQTVNADFLPALESLANTDPHDLITPETRFSGGCEAIGFVLKLMILTHAKMNNATQNI